jgi:hypothetical protein
MDLHVSVGAAMNAPSSGANLHSLSLAEWRTLGIIEETVPVGATQAKKPEKTLRSIDSDVLGVMLSKDTWAKAGHLLLQIIDDLFSKEQKHVNKVVGGRCQSTQLAAISHTSLVICWLLVVVLLQMY